VVRRSPASDRRQSTIVVYAKDLLRKAGMTGLPIDPFLIAVRLGISVREEPYDGVEGVLLRLGNTAGVGINRSIEYEARKRFTMAHELGHYYLPGHGDTSFSCTVQDLDDWRGKLAEREANEFAAELTMPLEHFQKDVDNRRPSLRVFQELASEKYQTSLLATAIRFTKLTSEPVALVMSTDTKPLWTITSQTFPSRSDDFVPMLSEDCYARDFFMGKRLPESPQLVMTSAWISSRTADLGEFLVEESMAMPRLGRVLTLLSIERREDSDLDSES
jgi:hypothetical protein